MSLSEDTRTVFQCYVVLASVSSLFSIIISIFLTQIATRLSFDLSACVKLTHVSTTGGCFSWTWILFRAERSAVYNTGCPLSMLHYFQSIAILAWPCWELYVPLLPFSLCTWRRSLPGTWLAAGTRSSVTEKGHYHEGPINRKTPAAQNITIQEIVVELTCYSKIVTPIEVSLTNMVT